MIDGWLPAPVRARIVEATRRALDRIDLSGTTPPAILPGTIGPRARSLGSASLPLSQRFMVEPSADVLASAAKLKGRCQRAGFISAST